MDYASEISFYPRHPRGWRLSERISAFIDIGVSIHATLAGGDGKGNPQQEGRSICFYPRHPRGWRPFPLFLICLYIEVSIHATLAGGDVDQAIARTLSFKFLSTPPSRVATTFAQDANSQSISFYPRHPRGWRQQYPQPILRF